MLPSAKKDQLWFKKCCHNKKLVAALKKIKLIICDVDGTLTDATIYVGPEGEGGRYFSTQDGFITQPAIKSGLHIALISGKENLSTRQRCSTLNINDDMCIVGKATEKITATKDLQKKLGISIPQTLIFGDDLLDAHVKTNNVAGLYICPQNTPFYLQYLADLIIPVSGGTSAFRMLLDLMLFLNKKHTAQHIIEKAIKATKP